MLRRTFLGSTAAAATAAIIDSRLAFARTAPDWSPLRRQLGDRLIDVHSPLAAAAESGGRGADALFAALKNPYYLSDEPARLLLPK